MEALIFDVDGTLYRQDILRRRMLGKLLSAYWRQPGRGLSAIRLLRAYRRSHEMLRRLPPSGMDLASLQIELAALRTGRADEEVASLVRVWMEREPLQVLRECMRPGLTELLEQARSSGLRLAVFSDYPAQEKLAAMGIAQYFDAVVCAQDADVQRLKPNPRGLEIVAQRLGILCRDAVYIGDRPELDGAAAGAAGMYGVIVRDAEPFPGLAQLLGRQAGSPECAAPRSLTAAGNCSR